MIFWILRLAYNPHINWLLRNLLLPAGKLFRKPLISVAGRLEVKMGNIRFHLHTNQTCSVTQELFFKGAKNYEFSPIFTHLIKECFVFFDIGANIGYFSVLSAMVNPGIQAWAFEPSIGALHYLKKNIESNQVQNNVMVVDRAVSDIDGTLEFHEVINPKYPWLLYNLNGSNSLQNIHGKQKNESYPVLVTTLEKVMKENKLKKMDLVKIDTECTEHYILSSSLSIINKYRPVIICEVYEVIRNEVQEIFDKFNDYRLFEIADNQLYLLNNLTESSGKEHNYIFCPQEKQGLLSKFIRENTREYKN